jgi:hypothetical protein
VVMWLLLHVVPVRVGPGKLRPCSTAPVATMTASARTVVDLSEVYMFVCISFYVSIHKFLCMAKL